MAFSGFCDPSKILLLIEPERHISKHVVICVFRPRAHKDTCGFDRVELLISSRSSVSLSPHSNRMGPEWKCPTPAKDLF